MVRNKQGIQCIIRFAMVVSFLSALTKLKSQKALQKKGTVLPTGSEQWKLPDALWLLWPYVGYSN
jgi:hypothetical protein